MDILITLAGVGFFIYLVAMPIAAFIRATSGRDEARDRIRAVNKRIDWLEDALVQLRSTKPDEPGEVLARQQTDPAPESVAPVASRAAVEPIASDLAVADPEETAEVFEQQPIHPPPPPIPTTAPPPFQEMIGGTKARSAIDWEQFMGVRLYAWVGGIALFLAVAYFVKYSFEQGWLPPEMRVALGFLLGAGLLVGGAVMRKKQYRVTSHTLCATGVLILYGVSFACRAIYHFAFFGPAATFGLMALITAAAFLISVRFDALAVAVLGMLGGFLTPILLSTGQDAPFGLFTYIALLDAGLLAIVLRRPWPILAPLAAGGTVLMIAGWAARFFEAGRYFEGGRILIPMAVILAFAMLWLAVAGLARRKDQDSLWVAGPAASFVLFAFVFAFYFQSFEPLARRPWLLLSFLFIVDGLAFGVSWVDAKLKEVFPLAGALTFCFLSYWMARWLSPALLPPALVFALVFALAHSVLPLVVRRMSPDKAPDPRIALAFPPIALAVLLIPAFRINELAWTLWPVLFVIDLLAVGLAAVLRSVVPVAITMALTLIGSIGLLVQIPSELTGLPSFLIIVGLAAVLFVGASLWLGRRAASGGVSAFGNSFSPKLFEIQASFSAALPFALLVMAAGLLNLANPSPVFGLALLLVCLLLALTRLLKQQWLPVVGLACAAALEHVWHLRAFRPELGGVVVVWHLVFYAVFTAHPFVRRRQVASMTGPWVAAALAGPSHFYLIYQTVKGAWPNPYMGMLAAVFAIPAFAGLAAVIRTREEEPRHRLTQMALFGGTALFFVTLIFPLQFSREWITVSWALEGAALCWLYHRVPHPGLRLVGIGLGITAFARLALNPAVLAYHARSAVPLLNWYCYTYGLAAACLYISARLLAPPRNRVLSFDAPSWLNSLATILSFLLLNIEIADFFTAPGASVLTFEFSGNFARDMSFSVGWALFSLGLVAAGIAWRLRAARYGGLGLLGVTLLKLFIHDLARLAPPYRIGALAAVAIVALAASFLYQRFVGSAETPAESDEARG